MRTTRRRAAAGSLIAVTLASGLAGVVLGRAWGVAPPAERTAPADLATTPAPAPQAEATPGGRPTTPSRRSAAAAAASFTSVLGGALALDRARYHAALAAMSTPEARARLLASAERTLDALDRGLGLVGAAARGEAVLLRSVPVAYSLDAFSPRAASVRVWFATIFSARGGIAQAWGTATLDLRWLAGWRLADWETAAGPTPSLPRPPDPVSVHDLGPELAGFSGFRQLPERSVRPWHQASVAWRPVVALALCAALFVALPTTTAAAAPLPVRKAQSVCDAPVIGVACDAAGAVVNAAGAAATWGASQVFDAIGAWIGEGAAWLVDQVGRYVSSTVEVNVDDATFVAKYRVMGGIALLMALPFLLLSVAQAVIRQDAGQIVRAAFLHVPIAVLVSVAGIELTQMGLELTDWMSAAIAGGSAGDAGRSLSAVGAALGAGAAAGMPVFVFVLVAGAIALGALLLWAELLVRSAAIYAALLFLPLVLAALVWPTTAHLCRRLLHTLVALVLSKFVIVAVLSLGAGLVSAGAGDADINALLTGATLIFTAAFSPFVLLRLIPVMEAATIAQLEGRARAGLGTAVSVLGGAALAKQLTMAGRPGAAGPHGAAGVSPSAAGGMAQAASAGRVLGLGAPVGLAAYLATRVAGRGAGRSASPGGSPGPGSAAIGGPGPERPPRTDPPPRPPGPDHHRVKRDRRGP